jgi:hypothetical protein
MGTPRPTIEVDNLDTQTRPWPKCAKVCYDNGGRFCFRIGKKAHKWKWPWPEYIGIPTRSTVNEWFDDLEEWKDNTLEIVDIEYLDECIRKMICYL